MKQNILNREYIIHMEQKGVESTVKAFPTNYGLNLISAGGEIIFWGNDLRMKSKIRGTSEYSKLLDLKNGRIAATKENGEINIINIYTKEIEFILQGHKQRIVAICAIDTENIGEHLIATGAGSYDHTISICHTIRIWNILTKKCIGEVDNKGYIIFNNL